MSKTIEFSIGERIAALKLFDVFKGDFASTAVLLEDVKQFPVKDEELEAAGLVKTPNDNGTTTWKWDDTVGVKEITLQDATLNFFKDELKRKSDAGEITLADVALISINKKVNA